MPSSTCTPVQSRAQTTTRLAGHANTVSALLSFLSVLPLAEQQNALLTCASILADVTRELDALVGGAS